MLKEAGIKNRYMLGSIFILVTIFAVIISIIQVMRPETFSIENIFGTLVFDIILIVVFGYFIGVKNILRAKTIVDCINSSNFHIEIDELIDKYDANTDTNNSCRAIFKYNEAVFPVNRWKEFKKGSKYYIFNFPKKETIVKNISLYTLDNELQSKLIDYHINPENKAENWE